MRTATSWFDTRLLDEASDEIDSQFLAEKICQMPLVIRVHIVIGILLPK